jgi:L-rhamnose isomerase / sugar isomerase
MTPFTVEPGFVAEHERALSDDLEADFEHLGRQLRRRGVEIETLVSRAQSLRVALPSWGLGTGGTRFARFPGPGEPRDVFEKLDDCATVQSLVRVTPEVSLHIPWDRPQDARVLKEHAAARGLSFGAMNSNTFQDQDRQEHSYKFGSLSHPDAAVREQAVAHNLECIAIGQALGSDSITVWIGDGGNFPGQQHFRRALERYLDSLRAIYRGLPDGWRMFLEHKLEEPAFYSTVLNDWGTSYWCSSQLGPKALSLVDLGHHAPNVNIEMIVSRLIQFGKLAGFHFNDSKYGDDDLDSGSIKPFQLFLVFNELVDAEIAKVPGFAPAYMLDQSHNVTDPVESLMTSAVEVARAFVQAHLVDREALGRYQDGCDPLMALATLKQAFTTDVAPILAMARRRSGGAVDPVGAYRASGYRARKAAERPAPAGGRGGGIV